MTKLTVLLIEDDEDDYLLTCDLLDEIERTDYEVTWCKDPTSGIDELQSGRFDVCLVDFRLGGETGIDVIERSANALRQTPAILLTGEHSTSVDEAAMRAGADDYLVKGELNTELLERTIRYAIQRREADARIEHLAFHDSLTDLPNRTLFLDRIDQALARCERIEGGRVTVVFFDIDNFKDINDSRGHSAGDELLGLIAERMGSILRRQDTLARLGGDEFAICMEDSTSGRPLAITFVERALEALRDPFELAPGAVVHVRASFGVAYTENDEIASDDLLRNADIAMYEAKRRGKNTWIRFEREMHDNLQRRIRLERDLREVMTIDGFELAYQPFFTTRTNEVLGFEALARWDHPALGPQSPAEFIRLAEDSGAIVRLGEHILRLATGQAAAWTQQHGFDGFMSVNVSPRQLLDPEFSSSVVQALEDSGLSGDRLVIEITESVMSADTELVIQTLSELTEIGVRVALDDFGTGYSSLSNVHQLPIAIVKVDRSFVGRIDEPQGRSMLTAIAAMAESLDVITIAEGIETEAQQEALVSMGYEIGQGFLFDRGRPAHEAVIHLAPEANVA